MGLGLMLMSLSSYVSGQIGAWRGANTISTSAETASSLNKRFDLKFDLPEPASPGERKTLWATYYYVYGDVRSVPDGQPLLNLSGDRLGPLLSVRDWCLGAIEGTIRVVDSNGHAEVYNYAGRGDSVQVDCSGVIHSPSINLNATGSSRYRIATGPFGDGVPGMILVPYRTIAADTTVIPIGTVIYIPAARGMEIILPSGRKTKHDGYFYVADVGGAIKGNHIDVFGGILSSNPFPNFIKNKSSQTFEAFVIADSRITERLKRLHTLSQ
ncbi:MAG TPA: 3D domain-containing protein [Pyrinomonadaceae bacterium]|nr:3D domain-containing protein [Pyrinomonadaceae bacterium]